MMKYVVYYKGCYHEYDEWFHETFEAPSPTDALQQFFRAHSVRRKPRLDREYKWWEGDWLMVYRGIDLLDEDDREPCPECGGVGSVPSRKPVSWVTR